MLPSGVCPANPNQVLASNAMAKLLAELKQEYDFIIVDTPPLLPSSDALTLAHLTEAVMLVTMYNYAHRGQLFRAYSALLDVKASVIGVVLNNTPRSRSESYYIAEEPKPRRPWWRPSRKTPTASPPPTSAARCSTWTADSSSPDRSRSSATGPSPRTPRSAGCAPSHVATGTPSPSRTPRVSRTSRMRRTSRTTTTARRTPGSEPEATRGHPATADAVTRITGAHARLYESVRSAHLERARELEPAAILYRQRRYDFDESAAEGLELIRASPVTAAWLLVRSKVRVLEINEPLQSSSAPATALALAALGIARVVGRPRTTVVCYAIENADPRTFPAPSPDAIPGAPRGRVVPVPARLGAGRPHRIRHVAGAGPL